MTPEILAWLESAKRKFISSSGEVGDVLEVGSYDVNGSPRTVFDKAKSYVGVDQEAIGPGVDIVANAHGLDLGRTFDVVICCETLEHDPEPFETLATLKRHLRPGGWLIITTPGNGFGEHFYPRDYWRFMPNAYEDLFFADMEVLEIRQIQGPTMCGIGMKPLAATTNPTA